MSWPALCLLYLVVSCICILFMLRCSMKRADRLDYKIYHKYGVKVVMDEKVDETGAHALAGNYLCNLVFNALPYSVL